MAVKPSRQLERDAVDDVKKGKTAGRSAPTGEVSGKPSGLTRCRVYTPRKLADAMVSALRPDSSDALWLEPSFGHGVFLESIHAAGVAASQIVAVDLDRRRSAADQLAEVWRGVDFLEWSAGTAQRFHRIIGNPPFVAIRSLPNKLRRMAASIEDLSGHTIGQRANTWYAFLLASIRLLADGGHLAFVLPASCEYANYSLPLRSQITSLFDRVDLVRSREPLFDGVQEGSNILLCRTRGGNSRQFRRHEVANLAEAMVRIRDLQHTVARKCPPPRACEEPFVSLGTALSIRLGAVTGDSQYFLLTEDQRQEVGLPLAAVTPVVTKSWHISRPHITAREWRALCRQDARVWLFNPPPSVLGHPAVQRYLAKRRDRGGCQRQRYKIRNRDPWYTTPLPPAPDAFISGMSGIGPWLCLNRMRGLNATNTLYVATFRERLSLPEKYAWGLSCMTTATMRQIRRAVRIYADGLNKIEPGQLSEIVVPVPPPLPNAQQLYEAAFRCLLNGNVPEAKRIADSAILGDGDRRLGIAG